METDEQIAAKKAHAERLQIALVRKGLDRATLAQLVGRDRRTISNWANGHTLPDRAMMMRLAEILGDYNVGGADAVETALRNSGLHPWRQSDVLALYQRHLHEQAAEVRDVG